MPFIPIIIVSFMFIGIYKAFRAARKPGTDEEDIKNQKEIVLDDAEDILKERSYDWGGIRHDTN